MDPATGKTKWAVTCPEIDTLAVSPDGKTLAATTASSRLPLPLNDKEVWNEPERVFVARFDAATGESKVSVQVAERDRLHFRREEPFLGRPIRFTADGKGVLVQTGRREALTIDAEQWAKGKERNDITVGAWYAPDGKTYLPAPELYSKVRVIDTTTNEPVEGSPPPLPRVLWYSGNGTEFLAGGKRLRFGEAEFDTATGKEVARVTLEERRKEPRTGVVNLYFREANVTLPSPDGKLVLRQQSDRRRREKSVSEVVEAESGKRVAELPAVFKDLVAFTPDSKRLLCVDNDGAAYLWDPTKADPPQTVAKLNDYKAIVGRVPFRMADTWAAVAEPNVPWSGVPDRKWTLGRVEFEPFKRTKVWQGKGWLEDFQITPGGGIVGWAELETREGQPKPRLLFVIDPSADGPREYPLEAGTGFAVSPDGCMAAVGVGSGTIELYELATGKKCHTFTGLKRPVTSLAFSPDGKTLASESADGPVILWDVRGDLTRPAKPDAAGWEAAWKNLTGDDTEKAFAAVRLIAAFPDDGAAELKKRFAEAKAPTAVSAERAVEALRLADTEPARKQIAEWAKGTDKDPLTIAAKRK